MHQIPIRNVVWVSLLGELPHLGKSQLAKLLNELPDQSAAGRSGETAQQCPKVSSVALGPRAAAARVPSKATVAKKTPPQKKRGNNAKGLAEICART